MWIYIDGSTFVITCKKSEFVMAVNSSPFGNREGILSEEDSLFNVDGFFMSDTENQQLGMGEMIQPDPVHPSLNDDAFFLDGIWEPFGLSLAEEDFDDFALLLNGWLGNSEPEETEPSALVQTQAVLHLDPGLVAKEPFLTEDFVDKAATPSFHNHVYPTSLGSSVVGPSSVSRQGPALLYDDEDVVWTREEISLLKELLVKYPPEQPLLRYAKIARHFDDKTIIDVKFQCSAMNRKEKRKRRMEDNNSGRKMKNGKKHIKDSSVKFAFHLTIGSSSHSGFLPPIPLGQDADNLDQAGGVVELLQQYSHLSNQISANFEALQIQDNFILLAKARECLISVLNEIDKISPEKLKQFPPLHAKIKEELANVLIPKGYH